MKFLVTVYMKGLPSTFLKLFGSKHTLVEELTNDDINFLIDAAQRDGFAIEIERLPPKE